MNNLLFINTPRQIGSEKISYVRKKCLLLTAVGKLIFLAYKILDNISILF